MMALNSTSNVSSFPEDDVSQGNAFLLPQLQDYEHPHWIQFYRNGQLPVPRWVHMSTGLFILAVGLTGTVGNALLAWAFTCTRLPFPVGPAIAVPLQPLSFSYGVYMSGIRIIRQSYEKRARLHEQQVPSSTTATYREASQTSASSEYWQNGNESYESLRSPSNLLIVNLAIADFGLSAVTFPLLTISSFAEKWVFGKAGCDYYGASAGFFGMLSISTMASIAVDRYFSITSRVEWHLTYRKVTYWIIGLWIYAFSLVIPPVLGWSSYVLEGIQTSCTWDFLTRSPADIAFTLYLFGVGYCVPVMVIAVCYTRIVHHIMRHRKLMANIGFGTSGGPMRSRASSSAGQSRSRADSSAGTSIRPRTESAASRNGHHHRESTFRPRTTSAAQGEDATRQRVQLSTEIRAAVTCFIIVFLFSLAWSPYAIIALTSTFGYPNIVTPYINSLPALFAKTNTIYNPVVYALMNERFRNALWSIIWFHKGRNLPGNRLSSFLRISSPRGSDATEIQRMAERARRRLSSRTTSITLATTPVSPTQPLFPNMQQSSFDVIEEDNQGMVYEGNEVPRRASKEFYNGQVSIPSVIFEERSSAVRQANSASSSRPDLQDDDDMFFK